MTIRQAEEDLRAPTAVIAGYLRKSISISYLIGLVWAGRLIVVAAAVFGLLYGVYTVHSVGPLYVAIMRVSPAANDTSAAGASGLLAGLTGGAGAVQVPKFTQFLFARDSIEVARELDRKYDLLCRVYRGDCDQVTHQWKDRTGVREWFRGALARLSGLPDPNVGPRTPVDLATYVTNTVSETVNKTNSIVALSFTDRRPEFAAQFLSQVVKTTNDYIRAQSRESQKRYVEYLTQSAAKATNVEQRMALDTLLLQEERQLMMTEVDIPYAAQILDGPTVVPLNDALKRIAIWTILGMVLGTAIAMSRDLLPRKWRVW